MEELGFKIKTTTNNKIIYIKVEKYDGRFLGMEEDKKIVIFNKNSKRVFLKRIIKQGGKEHDEPFCADVKLLNGYIRFYKKNELKNI